MAATLVRTPSTPAPRAPANPDVHYWAEPRPQLTVKVEELPPGAVNLNVDGRKPLSPLNGFGRLCRKTYSVRLEGSTATPAEVVRSWKQYFGDFWPKGNYCYVPCAGIVPGEVALLNLTLVGPLKLHTGVWVVYADETSFTFMTVEGHMFGGLITFSAHSEDGVTVAQVQPLIRASDPFFELTMRLGIGGAMEDRFWHASLRSLAARFGVTAQVGQRNTVLDPHLQWSQARNIWYNAAIRTTFYQLATPLRWLGRTFAR
jgi:hypothetical protein